LVTLEQYLIIMRIILQTLQGKATVIFNLFQFCTRNTYTFFL